MHDDHNSTTGTLTVTIDEETQEVWGEEIAWSLAFSRGEQECSCKEDEANGGAPSPTCQDCHGTGYMNGESALHTCGDLAAIKADELDEAIDHVADVVACCRAALERHAQGRPLLDYCPPEAIPLVEELERIGLAIARAKVVAGRIAEACGLHEVNDPRVVAREAGGDPVDAYFAHPHIIDTMRARRVLRVERFEGLERLYGTIERAKGVSRIDFAPSAYEAYYEARESLTAEQDIAFTSKLHEACGGAVPVRVVKKGDAT